MYLIRPCADLRNNYNEISKLCHKTKEPIFITKNGVNDLVILSDETYDKLKNSSINNDEKRIELLIEKCFDKHYKDFEEFKKYIIKQVNEALREIQDGKGIPMEEVVKEMEAD